MFFKILGAEIFGMVIGLIIGVIGLLIGGRGIFQNIYFLGIIFAVAIVTGLVVFKVVT